MKHPVSGEIKELNKEEFLNLFHESVRPAIIASSVSKPGIEAVVCLEVLAMDSSCFGDRAAMIIGPGCTYNFADLEKSNPWCDDLPSRSKYPTALWRL